MLIFFYYSLLYLLINKEQQQLQDINHMYLKRVLRIVRIIDMLIDKMSCCMKIYNYIIVTFSSSTQVFNKYELL